MHEARYMTAIIEREDDAWHSLLSWISPARGNRANLIEALMLFFETASPSEVSRRFHNEVFVTQVEVAVGQA